MDVRHITNLTNIPSILLDKELAVNSAFYTDLVEIQNCYKIYHKGCEFRPEGSNGDYEPSSTHFRKAANLINKEARFMFGRTPEVTIVSDGDTTVHQTLINKVLQVNGFGKNIVKAAKDCFIGKRIAIMLNFNAEDGITVSFIPALNFVYETYDNSPDRLKKIVAFIPTDMGKDYAQQRIFRKAYEMEGTVCYASETVYDGLGNIIEDEQRFATKFSYIPAAVILNDGLLGNMFGESEIETLKEYEELYSKISNADVDAERQSMNPIRYAIDASSESTANLSISAGSFWDIQSDPSSPFEGTKAQVGVLETAMSYSSPLKETLQRISTIMHDTLDSPDISLESMQGIITSGKALKAIYWALIVRCDEKMKAWAPGLELVCRAIIDGALYYPESVQSYIEDPLPNIVYKVQIENIYPLPEEETEEKTIDIMEVNAQVMSRKAYMIKWRGLTEEQVDAELKQIALEKQLLEDSYMIPPTEVNEDE